MIITSFQYNLKFGTGLLGIKTNLAFKIKTFSITYFFASLKFSKAIVKDIWMCCYVYLSKLNL